MREGKHYSLKELLFRSLALQNNNTCTRKRVGEGSAPSPTTIDLGSITTLFSASAKRSKFGWPFDIWKCRRNLPSLTDTSVRSARVLTYIQAKRFCHKNPMSFLPDSCRLLGLIMVPAQLPTMRWRSRGMQGYLPYSCGLRLERNLRDCYSFNVILLVLS